MEEYNTLEYYIKMPNLLIIFKLFQVPKEKIKTIYLKDAATYDLEENEYIKVLYNWGEIYRDREM